jgi:hypothetical protein
MPLDLESLAGQVATAIHGAVGPIATRLTTLESQMMDADHAIFGRDGLAARLGALETRAPVAGPTGPPGPPGPAGPAGKDGVPLTYLGAHVPGKTYDPGDIVSAGGSAWYCGRTTTAAPSTTAPDWTLMVRRGRDARGRD